MSPPPVRTCVGCGRKAPQSELLRFVAPERHARRPDGTGRGAARTPAGGLRASSAPRRGGRSHVCCAAPSASIRLWLPSTLKTMADGPNKPNRPIRPRQGGLRGRKRRVVIDTGAARPRPGRPPRRASSAASRPTKQPREVVAPTGPVTVPSGVTVRELRRRSAIPVAQIIKMMMGLGEMVQITQSLLRRRGAADRGPRSAARSRSSTPTRKRSSPRSYEDDPRRPRRRGRRS